MAMPSKVNKYQEKLCRKEFLHLGEAQEMKQHPRKRMYRARAHSNPLNDANFDVPAHPDAYDW